MTLPYAYAPRGQRAVGRVPKNRGENTSLVAAISLDEGVGDAMTLTGAVDGVAFLAYIEQVIAPKLRPGQIVVMDQLGVHRKPEVREAIEARGCELVLLPGYSPDFNPIELAFSKIKAFVKAVGARTRGALDSGSRLRYRRCRWGMCWVGLSMPESPITHSENRCDAREAPPPAVVHPFETRSSHQPRRSSLGRMCWFALPTLLLAIVVADGYCPRLSLPVPKMSQSNPAPTGRN